MPGPLMTAKEAAARYKVRFYDVPDDAIVYHRGNLKFSRRDEKKDKLIIAGSMDNHIGEKYDPYAHTSDEPRIDKEEKSSSVKMRGIRRGWSTWRSTSDRKRYMKEMKPIHVSKNKPSAKKPRKQHVRKKPSRRKK